VVKIRRPNRRLRLLIAVALGLAIDVFYAHQNDGFSRPGDMNALGLTLKTRF